MKAKSICINSRFKNTDRTNISTWNARWYSLIFSKYNMSDRLPSFEYSQEILHDTTPTQNPDCLQRDADQNWKLVYVNQGHSRGHWAMPAALRSSPLARMNRILLKWKLIFISLYNSLVFCFQKNSFQTTYNSQRIGECSPAVEWLHSAHLWRCWATWKFAFLTSKHVTSLWSMVHLNECETFLRKFCLFFACFKDLLFDLSNETSLQAFKYILKWNMKLYTTFQESLK